MEESIPLSRVAAPLPPPSLLPLTVSDPLKILATHPSPCNLMDLVSGHKTLALYIALWIQMYNLNIHCYNFLCQIRGPLCTTSSLRNATPQKNTGFLGVFPKFQNPPSPLLGTPVSKKNVNS